MNFVDPNGLSAVVDWLFETFNKYGEPEQGTVSSFIHGIFYDDPRNMFSTVNQAANVASNGSSNLLGKGGTLAATATLGLNGAAALQATIAIAQDDYNMYVNTGNHKYKQYAGVHWQDYGDNFQDAYKACPKKW